MSPGDPGQGRRHTSWRPPQERPRGTNPEPAHRTATATRAAPAVAAPATPAQPAPASRPARGDSPMVAGVRYVLPAVVVLAGLIVMAFGSEVDLEGGAGIIGAGVSIFVVNLLVRAGTSGEAEREREQAARDYLSEHGHWPE